MKLARLAALAAMLIVGPAFAQQPVVLKFAADTPSAGSLWAKSLGPWADRVQAASKGTLKIEKYPDGVLAPQGQTVNRVVDGVADIAWDLPLLYGARFQSLSVAGLPFMYDDADKAAVAMWRLMKKGTVGGELSNVMMLAFIVNPNVMVFTKEPVKDLSTLDGRKITVGSQTRGQIVEAMKGVPISLKVPELFQSLSRGVADGSMTNVAVLQAMKLDMLHNYINGPFGGAVAILFMNKARFDALPADAKAAILANSEEAGSRQMSREAMEEEGAYMKSLLVNPKNQFVNLDGPALEKWRSAMSPIVAEWTKTLPNGQAIVDGLRAELAAVK